MVSLTRQSPRALTYVGSNDWGKITRLSLQSVGPVVLGAPTSVLLSQALYYVFPIGLPAPYVPV
ncbi:hypothetical protein HaLaN_31269, partial [Haematococcus lacustris]